MMVELAWLPSDVANVDSHDTCNFLQDMNVPVNSLHSHGFLLMDCKPCIMAVLPGQHTRKGSTWLQDTKAEGSEFREGNYIKWEVAPPLNLRINGPTDSNGNSSVTGIFSSKHLVLQSRYCSWRGSPLYNFYSCGANECLLKKREIDLLMAFTDTFDNGIHEQCHELLAQN